LTGAETVYFVSGNKGKYNEVASIAEQFGVRVKWIRHAKKEMQSDNLREIACLAAKDLCAEVHLPVVAEDSGFFVHALGGFPGPYSAYVHRTIGTDGILRLLRSVKARDAHFQAVVALCKPKSRPVSFSGVVEGTVSIHPKGSHGFGFDPIFIPRGGDGRTFAEMSTNEKNAFSHRSKAFSKLFSRLTK
jgi:XTP/dITP diphosphohydrolase